MAILENYGAHGTTASRADAIHRTGFRAGGASFWGAGVYFFHRFPDGLDLASKWHARSLASGEYALDGDKSCVVIYAKIKADEENVFDLYDKNAYPLYYELIQQMEGMELSPEEKNHARDKWLRQFEAYQGVPIKILCCSIPVPKKQFRPVKEACCIVVRDAHCIQRPYESEVPHE